MAAGKAIELYYAPDLDPSWDVNPGVLNVITNYVPTKRKTYANFANGPTQNFADAPTWAIATYGVPVTGYVFKGITGAAASARMFICSASTKFRIIELTAAGAVTDRSKGAADYSNTITQWTMTAAGTAVVACNGVDAMQVSVGAAFADLGGGAPAGAQCLTTNLGFMLAGYKGDGTNGDAVGWSALGNYASWTASLATQAGNYRLLDTPGPIRALVPLRDSVIAYKDDSIYIGDYIGDTVNGVIWGWRVVSNEVGCASPHGVAVLNNVHYFMHRSGVFSFDGTQVVNIGNVVQKEVLRRLTDTAATSLTQANVDSIEGVIYWAFTNSPTPPASYVFLLMYNVNTGMFGGCMVAGNNWHETTATNGRHYAFLHANIGDLIQWESSLSWPTPQNGHGTAPIFIGSNDAGTTAELRMPLYNAAVVNSTAADAQMQSGWLTTGPAISFLSRIWPRFLSYGTQAAAPTASLFHQRREGDASGPPAQGSNVSPAPAWNTNNYCFDCSTGGAADRALQYSTTVRGAHEIGGVGVDIEQTSPE